MYMYILNHLNDGFAQPYTTDERISNQINEVLLCKSLIKTWDPPYLTWYKNDGEKLCDFPFMYSFIPIINLKTYNILKEHVPPNEAEFLPLFIENETYYIINLLILEKDILNIKKSKVKYYSNGRIMEITDFVFNKNTITTSMFRVSESTTNIFVNEFIKNEIDKHRLIGANFIKCRIAKPSIFDNFF